VLVAPPNPLVGIGGALRHAFTIDGATRSIEAFALLLERLDRECMRRSGRAERQVRQG
jgi:hypothetical protein